MTICYIMLFGNLSVSAVGYRLIGYRLSVIGLSLIGKPELATIRKAGIFFNGKRPLLGHGVTWQEKG